MLVYEHPRLGPKGSDFTLSGECRIITVAGAGISLVLAFRQLFYLSPIAFQFDRTSRDRANTFR